MLINRAVVVLSAISLICHLLLTEESVIILRAEGGGVERPSRQVNGDLAIAIEEIKTTEKNGKREVKVSVRIERVAGKGPLNVARASFFIDAIYSTRDKSPIPPRFRDIDFFEYDFLLGKSRVWQRNLTFDCPANASSIVIEISSLSLRTKSISVPLSLPAMP